MGDYLPQENRKKPATGAPATGYTPSDPNNWQTLTPPADVQAALDQLAARGQRVVLAALGVGGTWNPGEYVGPHYAATSSASVSTYSGSGYYRAPQKQRLREFAFPVSSPTSYVVDLHIYVGPNPASMAFSGIVLTTQIGAYVVENLLDTLDLDNGDCVAVLNSDGVNILGVGACAVSALAIPIP